MVISVGVDVVDIDRLGRALERTPALRQRVFGDHDTSGVTRGSETASLAARFAAKEATLKALGGHVAGFSWHDIQVTRPERSAPSLVVTGGAARVSQELGIERWHLSLSHDGGVAIAFVVAESGAAS